MKTIFTTILALMLVSFSFAEGDTLQASANIINESSQGTSDGSIDLTVSGGTSPYTFEWSNGKTTEDIMDLSAGTYDVTISDDNDNTVEYSYDVSIEQTDDSTETDPCQNFYGQAYVTNATNGDDGSIDLEVSGGTSPYTYSWNNGATSEDIHNLSAGHYIVEVSDDNGCQFSLSTYVYEDEIDSSQYDQPVDTVETNLIDTCFDAAVDYAVINGVELSQNTLTISWLVFDEDNNLLGVFTEIYNFTNDSAGVYNIVVSFECGRSTINTFSQNIYIDRGVAAGIVSLEKEAVLNIYPNPVQNMATINIESQKQSEAKWSIISVTGKVIVSNQVTLDAGNNTLNINTSSLDKGIYILRLTQNNQVISKQFVK